jgi:hypothetical protein
MSLEFFEEERGGLSTARIASFLGAEENEVVMRTRTSY